MDLNGNALKENVQQLKQLRFLKKLNLGDNGIEELWELPKTLEELNLSYNQLKELPEHISNLQHLTIIDLSNNLISDVKQILHFSRLKYFLGKNNLIENLSSFSCLQNLIECDLENNNIGKLTELKHFTLVKSLLIININGNPIQS